MKASTKLIEAIKQFEGFRATAYRCPAGVWTIGYGHTGDVRRGQKITKEDAEKLLKRDLIAFESFVERLNVTGKQEKFDALVDFAYNVGTSALQNSTLLKKIRQGRPDEEVRAEFMKWVYTTVAGRKIKLDGLVERRKWEADMYFNLL